MNFFKSTTLFDNAQQYIPGGVNSPVRAFRQVGGKPVFMQSAKGAYMYDVDGNRYLDYINSWGPMILGHSHPEVVAAVVAQAQEAMSFGTPTELEVEVAKLINEMVPNADLVRMTSSGTEACMSAVRLARGYTNRSKIIKFEGHYHGHADFFLKKAGSGMATLGITVEAGVTTATSADTLVAAFNDFEGFEALIKAHGSEIAAVIVEPVAGNMGCVPPKAGYLELLRKRCTEHGIVLILDEVMTGFRLSKGGASMLLGIEADLMTFGKIIGGGMPVGCFAGKRAIMEHIAPLGNVYQAGTLSGNPMAMTAGYTLLKILNENPQIYTDLAQKTEYLHKGFTEILNRKGITHQINRLGSMISIHFCENEVIDFQSATHGNNDQFKAFFHGMLQNEVYLPPSAFETWFLCQSLTTADLDYTLEVADKIL